MNRDYRENEAWRHYRLNRYGDAIEVVRGLLAEEPEAASCHALLGACLMEMGRFHAAEHELQVALSLDHGETNALVIYAQLQVFQNQHEHALELADRALAIDSELIGALLIKQRVYSLQNRSEAALQCLRQAQQIDPESLAVTVALGDCYLAMGQQDEANRYASLALSLSPEAASAHVLMGEVCLHAGDIEKAREHACYAISRHPESSAALHLLGNIKMRQNRFVGLWWRANAKLSGLTPIKTALVLVGAYLLFSLLSVILRDLGYVQVAGVVSIGWLLLAIYSWVGLPIYQRALRAELDKVALRPDF